MPRRINLPALTKVFKIAVGSCLAILLARFFGIQYSASAGIITLLSIQDTKKATLWVAARRLIAFAAAMMIAFLCFSVLGFTPYAFGLFLVFFAGICVAAGLQDGISICSVLVTHFLVEESMSFYWIKNEVFLLLIGTSVGIILNLYMPRFITQIRERQLNIEWEIRLIFKGIATFLADEQHEFQLVYDFGQIEAEIDSALKQAYADNDNILLYDFRYFIMYMEMRKSQIVVLKHIMEQVTHINGRPVQAHRVAALIDDILLTLRESNNAVKLLENLNAVKSQFKANPLPESRAEFEDRAILYAVINSLEQFLEFKRSFAENLSEEEKRNFWSG